MKFGGSCFKGIKSIKRVIKIIKEDKRKKIIVVSAFYGITNLLIDLIETAVRDENLMKEKLGQLKEKHLNILKKFGISSLGDNFLLRFEKLEKLFLGIHYTQDITDLTKAAILSYGERFSAIILSMILNKNSLNSFYVETDDDLIITDNSFNNATAYLEETKENIKERIMPAVRKGKIPIFTGFFGANRNGRTTTFGRNGSDYSASVIAYSSGSKELILWKDTEGFMSADPNIIKTGKQIRFLSYYEAAELSYFGAKIIHPRTFEPIMKKKIVVFIKNILFPETEPTIIQKECYKHSSVIKSVTYNNKISVLRVLGTGVGEKPGIISEIGKSLSEQGINIISIITSQTCINLIIDKHDSKRGYDILKHGINGIIKRVKLEKNFALIGLVGAGLKSTRGVFARVFNSVASAGVNIEMVSGGASDVAYYIIVRKNDLRNAVKAIHKEFFLSE
jgi:aspartate kinase